MKLIKKLKFKALKWLLKDRDIYYIVTGLRGNDSEKYSLKRIFALRLRHFLDLKRAYIDTRETPKIKFDDIIKAITEMTEEDEHYLIHQEWAFESLMKIIGEKKELRFLMNLANILALILGSLEIHNLDSNFRSLQNLLEKYNDFIRVKQ